MFYVSEVRINKSGYDRDGQYWGIGQKLFAYRYEGDHPEIHDGTRHLRAVDRNDAKDKIRSYFRCYFPDHITFAR